MGRLLLIACVVALALAIVAPTAAVRLQSATELRRFTSQRAVSAVIDDMLETESDSEAFVELDVAPKQSTKKKDWSALAKKMKPASDDAQDSVMSPEARAKAFKVKNELIKVRKAQETLAKNILWHREHTRKANFTGVEQSRKSAEARLSNVDDRRLAALKLQVVDTQANLTQTVDKLVGLRNRRQQLLAQADQETQKKKQTEADAHRKEAQEILIVTQQLVPLEANLSDTLKKAKNDLEKLAAKQKSEQQHKTIARKYALEKINEDKAKAQHKAALSRRSMLKAIARIKRKHHQRAKKIAKALGRPFKNTDDGSKEWKLARKKLKNPPPPPTPPKAFRKGNELPTNGLSANMTAVNEAVPQNLTGVARDQAVRKAVLSEHKKSMIAKMKLAINKFREEQAGKKKQQLNEQNSKEADQKRFVRMNREQGRKRNVTESLTSADAILKEKAAVQAKVKWEKSRLYRSQAEAAAKADAVADEAASKKRYASAAAQEMKQKALQVATDTYKQAQAAVAKAANAATQKAAEDAKARMLEAMRQADQSAAAQAADAAAAQSASVKANESKFKAQQAVAAVDVVAKEKDKVDAEAADAQRKAERAKVEHKKGDVQAELDMQNEAQQKLKEKMDAFSAMKSREAAAQTKLREWAEAIISADDSPVSRKFQVDMGMANPADMPDPTPPASPSSPLSGGESSSSIMSFLELDVPHKIRFRAAAPFNLPAVVQALMDQLKLQVQNSKDAGATGKAAVSGTLLTNAVAELTGLEGGALTEAVQKMAALSPAAMQGAVGILAYSMIADEKDASSLENDEGSASLGSGSSQSAAGAAGSSTLSGSAADPNANDDDGPDADDGDGDDGSGADGDDGSGEGDEASEQSSESGDDPALSSESSLMSSMDASPLSNGSSSSLSMSKKGPFQGSYTESSQGDASSEDKPAPEVEINVVNHNILNARSADGAKNLQLSPGTIASGLMPSELKAIGDPDGYIRQLSQAALANAAGKPNPLNDQAAALTKLVASMVGSQLNAAPDVLPSTNPQAAPVSTTTGTPTPKAGLTAAPNSAFAGVTPVRFREF